MKIFHRHFIANAKRRLLQTNVISSHANMCVRVRKRFEMYRISDNRLNGTGTTCGDYDFHLKWYHGQDRPQLTRVAPNRSGNEMIVNGSECNAQCDNVECRTIKFNKNRVKVFLASHSTNSHSFSISSVIKWRHVRLTQFVGNKWAITRSATRIRY